MAVVYSKLSGQNDPIYGKFEHPIKALITSESDKLDKENSILRYLYNVEKSNKYAETILGQSDFDTFQHAPEGAGAENDNIALTYKKTIEHIPFMKEFTMTREMADDSRTGLSADVKSRAKNFYRAYRRTMEKIGAWALANGTSTTGIFNKAKVDLSAPDNKPLFFDEHLYATEKMRKEKQSNNFYANFGQNKTIDKNALQVILNVASNKMRNFKDENGEPMGYVSDTIILPSNRPYLEEAVKTVCGSERTTGKDFNDINIQYGNWNLVILPYWETDDDKMMIMSTDANQALMGNMFFNRVDLDIQNEIDIHTRNYIWHGYCRFGVGFGSWKHISLLTSSANAVATATKID